ncbi:unnamed protein product, partial [marine sediment metagenome]
MKISKFILDESLEEVKQLGFTEEEIEERLQGLNIKTPHIADFIVSARNDWEKNPPSTLEDQLQFLFDRLVKLVGTLSGEELETREDEEDYTAYFITGVLSSWKKSSYNLSLRQQIVLLSVHLLTLVDMFRRQREVDRLEEQFGKYFRVEPEKMKVNLKKLVRESLEEIAERGRIETREEQILVSTASLLYEFLQRKSDQNNREIKVRLAERKKEVGFFFPPITDTIIDWKDEGRE